MLLPFYENRKWGYIDEHAQMVIRPGFQGCGCFSEGVAPVCREGRYGYIDVSGREVIPGTFDWAGDFHEGVACVQVGEKFAVIDRTGRLLMPPVYDVLYPFDANARLFCAQSGEGKWGVVERTGKVKLHFEYDDIEGVGDDDWWKASQNRHHSFFDGNWNLMRSFEYDDMTSFRHGMSVVEENAHMGVIGKNGNQILPLHYEDGFVCSQRRICMRYCGENDYSFYYPGTRQWGNLRFDHCDGELGTGLVVVSRNGTCSLYDADEKCRLADFAESVQAGFYGRYHRFWVDGETMGYMMVDRGTLYVLDLDGVREVGRMVK